MKIKNGNGNPSLLKVVSWNLGSRQWHKKVDDVISMVQDHNPDVAAISEANMRAEVDQHMNFIPGYNISTVKDFIEEGVSRLVVLTREGLNFKLLIEKMEAGIASIWLSFVRKGKKPFIVGTIYREHKIFNGTECRTEYGTGTSGTEYGTEHGTEHGTGSDGTELGTSTCGTKHGTCECGTKHGTWECGTEHGTGTGGTEYGSEYGTEHGTGTVGTEYGTEHGTEHETEQGTGYDGTEHGTSNGGTECGTSTGGTEHGTEHGSEHGTEYGTEHGTGSDGSEHGTNKCFRRYQTPEK